MASETKAKIQGLWPLPGGNGRYLATLDQAVKWAATTSDQTSDDLANWFIAQYDVGKGSVSGYVQVVTKLGAIEMESGRLRVGPLGKRLLESQGDAKAQVVIERFMSDYLAFPEILSAYAQAGRPLHLDQMVETLKPAFPMWTSPAQYEYRALWLLSLGCLRQVKGRNYEITELGQAISTRYPPAVAISQAPPSIVEQATPTIEVSPIAVSKVDRLIEELQEASIDGQNPNRLEKAVAEAFEYLGFAVDQLGEAGNTDVLVRANVGPQSYAVVIDAKARRDGKLQELHVYTLQDHRSRNAADYAVVVAGGFAGGQVARHAQENGIVLMSTRVLGEWLRLHAATPLNMQEYKIAFQSPGIIEALPAALKSASEKHRYWAHLLVDLTELIRETYEHGLSQSLPGSQLFAMLVTRLRGVRYSRQDVERVIDLMSHPALAAVLGDADGGISLAMNRDTLVRALRAFADQVETAEAET